MSTSKDRRFLHTPPYAWEVGAVAAAAAIWKLLKSDEPDEQQPEPDQAGSAEIPLIRTQS